MTQIANSLQVLERIGGDDGTRTRGLCRDRGTLDDNLLSLNGTDSPLVMLNVLPRSPLLDPYRTHLFRPPGFSGALGSANRHQPQVSPDTEGSVVTRAKLLTSGVGYRPRRPCTLRMSHQ
jgi:hypothetical protein